jgi:hypothetical protein
VALNPTVSAGPTGLTLSAAVVTAAPPSKIDGGHAITLTAIA